MRLNRLSIASAGSFLALILLSGCQSIEDGFRYGFGYEANGPAGSTSGHARRSVYAPSETRRTYDYDAPRNSSGNTYTETKSSGYKRARYKTTETTASGTIVDRDEDGNVVRTGSRSSDTTTYRNTDGTISSSVYRSPAGVDTERDSSGQIVTSSSANPSGDTVTYRDGNGRILGTKYTSPAGNVTYRNASGQITGSDFQ